MKQRLAKFFIAMMLLSLTAQPLLVQARAVHNTAPPCPMQMMQQMEHQHSVMHGECVGHSSESCMDCGLCSPLSGNALLHSTVILTSVSHGAGLADIYSEHFASIALPVDFPPPRSL